MGRPLNKKFFGDGAGLLEVQVYTERAGAAAAGYIIRQRSNLKYEVADETVTDVDVDGLTVDSIYEITTAGDTDWVAVGAPDGNVGTRFTATGAGTGTGEAREIVFGTLQQGAPAAAGELQVVVSPVTGGSESARIINARQVKTFEGNTYVWPDLAAGDFRAQFEESDLATQA